MSLLRHLVISLALMALAACASVEIPPDQCPAGTQPLPNCPPPEAVDDSALNEWYEARTWVPADEWDEDPIELGVRAEIPVQSARMKLLGARDRDALYSLAAKIYAIENARHSIDAVYYIVKDDLVGRAILGALCEAVQRGVDVRLLVDSLGTISLNKNLLRALYQCQLDAAFIRNAEGELSTRRARVQVVVFNAISRIFVNMNRRSHDKLLVVDGFVPDRAIVMTGGRNISLSYYGIRADGSANPDTYLDAELLLRPDPASNTFPNVAEVAEIYFTLLNSFKNNKPIGGRVGLDRRTDYPETEADLKQQLERLKSLEPVARSLAAMPDYLGSGYHFGEVRLAHEFANLTDKRAITEAVANLRDNPNSIMHLLALSEGTNEKHIRLVSPYLFAARYYGPDGEVILDEAQAIRQWLAADEGRSYEIITNSVLTSDNFFAQAMVDMDTAPRLLLDEERIKAWQSGREKGELKSELIGSEQWSELVNHPQLKIYETGGLDDTLLGGDMDYGKLHSKYIVTNDVGFLGTANFDYRSRLFNNEMGFFFRSEALTEDFLRDFEQLRNKSYLWGSPEWLEMRRALVESGGMKGWTTKHQSSLYRVLSVSGLKWFF